VIGQRKGGSDQVYRSEKKDVCERSIVVSKGERKGIMIAAKKGKSDYPLLGSLLRALKK